MIKILNCYLNAKKSYGTLSKGAIFFGYPCISPGSALLGKYVILSFDFDV